MRIIRDYTCDRCGAQEEHFSDSSRRIELDQRPHYECPVMHPCLGNLRAQLSPVQTTFTHADVSPNKRRRGIRK